MISTQDLVNLTTSLTTPQFQEEYSVIKSELEQSFFTTKSVERKCNIAIGIEQTKAFFGLTSTTFSVNLTMDFVVKYQLKCNDDLSNSGIVKLNGDLTLVQEKTLGQYVGERHILHEISKRAAAVIHNEVKIFLILHNKKLDK